MTDYKSKLASDLKTLLGNATPAPPEQVETTDAADLLVDLELARLGDYPGVEGCRRMARALEHLTAKLSASEAEVARLTGIIDDVRDGFSWNSSTVQCLDRIASVVNRAALTRQEPEGCEHQTVAGPCSICGDMG